MGPKKNETRLNNFNMQPKTSYIQPKINNYKVVIPSVTIFLIHETKRNLIKKKFNQEIEPKH